MTNRTSPTSPRTSTRRWRPPLWLIEALEVVERRRRLLIVTVVSVLAAGVVVTLLFPGFLAPSLVTGAGVGLAAVLLGLAAVIAADATDLMVRGPRHVRASGGELVAVLPSRPSPSSAAPLAAAVLEAREGDDRPLLVGLAASGRDATNVAVWTDELAVALATTGGVSVLRIDLVSGPTDGPGLVEVVRDGRSLAEVAEIRSGTKLARLGAGSEVSAALASLPSLTSALPRDLDVLLVALPAAASRKVVAAAGPLDHVLMVAECGRTSRVELIAGLDAIESGGTAAQVILIDDITAAWLARSDDTTASRNTPSDDGVTPGAEDEPAVDPGGEHEPAADPGVEDEPAADQGAGDEPAAERAEAETDEPDGDLEPADVRPHSSGPAPRSAPWEASTELPRAVPRPSADSEAVGPRDVEVLIGAAAANAEVLTLARIEPLQSDARSVRPVDRGADPAGSRSADPAADRVDDPDATDEIPRVEAPGRRHDDEEERLLQTTAQLAMLEFAQEHDAEVSQRDRPAAQADPPPAPRPSSSADERDDIDDGDPPA